MLEFSKIDLKHRDLFNKAVKGYNYRNSESSFVSLFLWADSEHIEIAFGENAMFLRFTSAKDGQLKYFSPFLYDMKDKIKPAIDEIRRFLKKENEQFCIYGLISENKEKIENEYDHFVFTESRNSYDYVYKAESLINLSGKKLSAKRNHINYFLNNFDFEYKKYDSSMKTDSIALLSSWYDNKGNDDGAHDEKSVMRKILDLHDELDLKGGCVYVDGKMQALTFGEMLTSETALIHVEKANPEIRGLYPYINQQFIKNEWADYKYINREEDMGIEGLRKAKLSYNPEFLVEKYTCSLDGMCDED